MSPFTSDVLMIRDSSGILARPALVGRVGVVRYVRALRSGASVLASATSSIPLGFVDTPRSRIRGVFRSASYKNPQRIFLGDLILLYCDYEIVVISGNRHLSESQPDGPASPK